MSQFFDKIKVAGTKRSTFDLSHDQITTSDFGYLIPICYRDMVPNDDFVVTPEIFTRLAPLSAPAFARIKTKIFHFFVPYRVLYRRWANFITQSPSNSTVPPYFTLTDIRSALAQDPQFNSSLSDLSLRGVYGRLMANLGLNPAIIYNSNGLSGAERIAAMPFLAYYKIWLDYFMDTNINDHSEKDLIFKLATENGGNLHDFHEEFLITRNICYKKDYFTTAKLKPQDGVASMVGADVASDLNPSGFPANINTAALRFSGSDQGGPKVAATASSIPAGSNSKIAQFTVEALRAASSLQRYLERNNYVGSKLINRLLVHFGVSPTAERLDMAEFLGGDSFDIQIGDVTSHNSFANPGEDNYFTYGLGMQAGKGWGRTGNSNSVRYHASEHGIFMSLMAIVPDTSYYQGISRHWQKGVTGEPLDFFTPEFENLGYQELLNKEVYVPFGTAYTNYDPLGVFGWTPRYSEYKFSQDILAGDMVGQTQRVESPQGNIMDSWHTFRKLNYTNDSPLALNNNFVELNNRNTDYDRLFQLTDSNFDHFYFNIRVDVKATRPMVGFAEPSLDSNNEVDGNSINLPYGGTRL